MQPVHDAFRRTDRSLSEQRGTEERPSAEWDMHPAERALATVLEAIEAAAFLVRHGAVEPCNRFGAAALDREGDSLRERVVEAVEGPARGAEFLATRIAAERLVVLRRGRADGIAIRLESAVSRHRLRRRQGQVLLGLVDGLSNQEIAQRFGCAVRTVETHLTAMLEQSDMTSRLELVADFWSLGRPADGCGARLRLSARERSRSRSTFPRPVFSQGFGRRLEDLEES